MFCGEAELTSEGGFCLQKHSLPACYKKHKLGGNGCAEVQSAALKSESVFLLHCPTGDMGEVWRFR